MKRVLVSAFLPFNQNKNNYSAEVLRFVGSNKANVDKVMIDVVYDRCFEEIAKCGLENYDFIIALGEARMRDALTVEKRAKNISSCSLADNGGEIRCDQVIDASRGEYIESETDFDKIQDFADISYDAGKFVCNNLYFHLLSYDPKRTLFIHVPECNNDEEKYRYYADKINRIIESL